jgi:hypothetical protein
MNRWFKFMLAIAIGVYVSTLLWYLTYEVLIKFINKLLSPTVFKMY